MRQRPVPARRAPGRCRRGGWKSLAALAALVAACAGLGHISGQEPSPRWGRLANPGVEGHVLRTTVFFSGQAKDGTNPYGCTSTPPANLSFYTVSPADPRHLAWSSSASNRSFALDAIIEAGLNVVSLSTWGEDFLPCLESWALWAPMQCATRSHDELFAAAIGKPLWIMPFIESRANWTFYNEFPRWTDGLVAPGTVSQIINLVNRYLKNSQHPEWAQKWARAYDSAGQPRFAVALIHASSNRLGPAEHLEYSRGFDLVAQEVLSATGVRVGFFIDALPPASNAPGSFKPSPGRTGPFLLQTQSLLGIHCFLSEIWMTGSPDEDARIEWKRDFSRGWRDTGIPFLMDVSPGYDAHIVFPGSVRYGYTATWLAALSGMVATQGCDGLVYNFWNGYTEGIAGMPLEAAHGGSIYNDWLKKLTFLSLRCVRFRRGDANSDGKTDISDAVAILNYLFLGVKKVPCEQAGDANDDGALDISDGIYILNFLFTGGAAIQPPAAACGIDPTGHGLPCESFLVCP